MPDIKIDLIKPSPYQPRLMFDLEDIRGSIEKDGVLAPLVVRKKNDYYELIDGERRLRIAKGLEHKVVPCHMIDVDDETARRMVWTLNTSRKDYEPKEKAHHYRRLQKEFGLSMLGIARDCGEKSPNLVLAYLNVFKLPEEYQELVWAREIPIRVIRGLEKLFNGLTRVKSDSEIIKLLDRAATEKHFTEEQVREAISPYLAKLRAARVKEAKETFEKVAPKVKPPETAEEYEEAAKALKRKAKELMTPEQKAREKRKKQIAQAKKSLNVAVKKIDDAEKIANVGGFRKRLDKIKETLEENPAEVKDQLVALGKEVADAKRQRRAELKEGARRKKEQEEARKREKALERERKRIEAETRKRMLKDEEFLEKVAKKKRKEELKKAKARAKAEVEPWTEKMASDIADKIKDALISIAKEAEVKKTAEKGRLMRNYLFQGSIIQSLQNGAIFDPQDPKDTMLEWSRSHRNLPETREELKKRLGIK